MKLLVYLILAGKLLTVTAPQSIAAPDEIGALAQMNSDQSTFVYAHSDLSGTLFYDLQADDTVTAIYNDGSTQLFEVREVNAYAAKSNIIARSGGDFDLRVGSQWIPITGVMAMMSTPGGITLITCYAGDRGFGIVTGRLFVELVPVVIE